MGVSGDFLVGGMVLDIALGSATLIVLLTAVLFWVGRK
jgi:hypothetical protein